MEMARAIIGTAIDRTSRMFDTSVGARLRLPGCGPLQFLAHIDDETGPEVRFWQQIVGSKVVPHLLASANVSLVYTNATHGELLAAPALISDHPEAGLSDTDATLVARIRSGDETAVRPFYERHADRVYRTAWRVLRDRGDAETVTQDVFVRALNSLHQVRDTTILGAWLSAIAARASYDLLRTQRRESRRFLPLSQADEATAAPSPDPLLGDHLRQAIASLSSKLQLVLVMYELDGHSHAEIAAALGIPEATSKTRLSQARAQLRQLLAAYARTENDHE